MHNGVERHAKFRYSKTSFWLYSFRDIEFGSHDILTVYRIQHETLDTENILTHWPLGDLNAIEDKEFSS